MNKKITIGISLSAVVLIGGFFWTQNKHVLQAPTQDMSQPSLKQVAENNMTRINFFNFVDELSCIYEPTGKEFVIDSQEKYNELLKYRSAKGNFMDKDCKNFQLPKLDFTKQTLLGKNTITQTCKWDENAQNIFRDDNTKKIIYTINDHQIPCDQENGYSMNWVKIPKIPEGYTVEFKAE